MMVVHLIKRSAKKKRDFLPGVVFCLDKKPLMGDPFSLFLGVFSKK